MSKYNPVNWLHLFCLWLDSKWQLPTLEDEIRQQREEAEKEKRQAEAVIKRHRFIAHYASSKLAALETWAVFEGEKE